MLEVPGTEVQNINSLNVNTSATRQRLAEEIIPVSAELPGTLDNNEELNGAKNAIDLDLTTYSQGIPDSDGAIWLKLILDKGHCVEQVIRYKSNGLAKQTWTCSETDCSTCEGGQCDVHILTVYNVSPVSSKCNHGKYGDRVRLERTDGIQIKVDEIAVTGRQG